MRLWTAMRVLVACLPLAACLLLVTCLLLVAAAPAQEPTADGQPPDAAALKKKLEQTLTGAELVGQFTVLGKEGPPRTERYSIVSARPVPDRGDYWLITARIRYGDKDVSVPMPLEIKWAGDTPIITLTNLTIPGLGTFTSRVVIYNGKYAGTWTHGEVGGHLFGTIERPQDQPKADGESEPKEKPAPAEKP